MTLWTDFGDESNEFPNDDDDDVEEEKTEEDNTEENNKTNQLYHPYQHSYRGGRPRNNQYWRGYHHRQRPYYNNRGKWSNEKSSVKENNGLVKCNVNFFEDNFIFGEEEFSTVTFENDQFLKDATAAAQIEEKTSA